MKYRRLYIALYTKIFILQLPPPQMVSCAAEIKKDIYVKLATMAAFP